MRTHILMRWPNGKKKALTLSYDDGLVYDKKMVEILDKYGIKCTFNLNSKENTKGNPKYVQPEEYNEVYKNHEIAVHGKHHVSGGRIPIQAFTRDVIENRKELEEITDKIVQGMAYANGTFDQSAKNALKSCGIKYARTTRVKGDFELPSDWLELNPTCHHNRQDSLALADEFLALEEGENWRMFTPKLFYLWGHSFEFDRENNWELLESFCEKMSGHEDIWYAANIEIYDYVRAFNSLEFNLDLTKVYNPTATDVWFKTPDGVVKVKSGETVNF